MSKPPASWTCLWCRAKNLPFRYSCEKCGKPRPKGKEGGQDGQ